jgi:PAS domain S-box-containing protein
MTFFPALSPQLDTIIAPLHPGMEEERTEWLVNALKCIGDAVIACDIQGLIQFMNPVAEALTGWRREAALGRELRLVFETIEADTRIPRGNPIIQALYKQRLVRSFGDTLLISRDGTETAIHESCAPVQNDTGAIMGIVLVFRDITEQMQAQEALHQNVAELREHNEELLAFAYTVAHELKNPLNLICGFAELLHKDFAKLADGDVLSYLQIIAQTGLKIGNIIDELLLLAGVGQADVEIRPLHMASIVAEAKGRLALMTTDRGAIITEPAEWPIALGYAPWVEEVWVNYLSNGLKYGGQPPKLQLGATALPNGMIRFWIRDNGPGLTPEDQSQLFTAFTQLSPRNSNGHGLGLSIVRRIVDKLNGQVCVTSQVGHGSTFTFTLPSSESTL